MSHVKLSDVDLNGLKIGKVGRNYKILYNKEPFQLITSKMTISTFDGLVQNPKYINTSAVLKTGDKIDFTIDYNNQMVSDSTGINAFIAQTLP